ncbi:hypothetical protein FOA43_002614 [Brettanomyces nanus]|uniref:Uncharacterized protein n=1 Tax=Eeniella nana TaxID=13502 RepID=A0A875S7Z5_EENNA|nr:uncharacterized protein FOA43_002614 [Brettanomyces nanus]QPG75264.1 hypothetical protein FOA43_002614 [Brettanomyces nanus]
MFMFFTAADGEISYDYEGNTVNKQLLLLLDILEKKLPCPMTEYINLLYFATRNNFDDCCLTIMRKLSTLTDKFTNEALLDKTRDDEFMAIVSSALKFGDYDGAATKLMRYLKVKHPFDDFGRGEWISYLQYTAYQTAESYGCIELCKLIEEVNGKLDSEYHRDYRLNDTETYNCILESLCYSNKSSDFIESFSQEFDRMYELTRDARSFSILIRHYLQSGDVKAAVNSFETSLEEAVAWDDDYGGIYIPVLFHLLADYFDKTSDDLYYKTQVYKKIKAFEYPLDKNALHAMVKQFLKGNFVGDAMEIFEREVPSLKNTKDRYDISDYPRLIELYYRYAVTNCEDLKSNWLLYEFLEKFFSLPYEFYPALLKYWIDVGYPSRALKIYADMKQLSKENKLPPPREEIYIYLLQSFSRFQYEDGISKLQLAVKMDLSLNMDIKLLNALMGALCSIEDSFRVRDMFNQAQALPARYGLNQESCYWALKSLKFASLNEVNNFYLNLSQFEILPDANIFGEYLIAHCYYEQYGTALEKLIDTYENGDLDLIDRNVLRNFHNFCLNDRVRHKLDDFATEKLSQLWKDLKQSGELLEDTLKQPSLLDNPYQEIELKIR